LIIDYNDKKYKNILNNITFEGIFINSYDDNDNVYYGDNAPTMKAN